MNLKHLAIIMDGNGRWAKKQDKPRTFGHKMGAKQVEKITAFCIKNEIKFLTLYAFSTENWNRPKSEVEALMKLLNQYLKKEAANYHKNNIRFKAIGDLTRFNKNLVDLIKDLEDKTKDYTTLTQILALNYGSKNEISRAVLKGLNNLDSSAFSKLNTQMLENLIESNLDSSFAPSVDLLIRTGGEKRLSNFLLWQASYAELYFSDTLFPDFGEKELEYILNDFNKRVRTFGGI